MRGARACDQRLTAVSEIGFPLHVGGERAGDCRLWRLVSGFAHYAVRGLELGFVVEDTRRPYTIAPHADPSSNQRLPQPLPLHHQHSDVLSLFATLLCHQLRQTLPCVLRKECLPP